MSGRRAIAVAGAHGKTTTSAMVAVMLESAGHEPSYAIGGSIRAGGGALPGGRSGMGEFLVAEADESDGSFLNYRPEVAVVTNVEPDHLDHYGSAAAFERAFLDFAGGIRPGGTLVACADDEGAARLAAAHRARGGSALTYGAAPDADVRLLDFEPSQAGSRVTVELRASEQGASEQEPTAIELVLAVPGRFNALNALGALTAGVAVGLGVDVAKLGIEQFEGTGRRFEERGSARGVRVVDDYAHHPTEVRALLTAARDVAAPGRVLVLFQPHLFSRTRIFAQEFALALDLADRAVVTGIYAAREDPEPGIGPETIVDLMGGSTALAVPDRFEAARVVADAAVPGDLILTVGAGDVTELPPVILEQLRARG